MTEPLPHDPALSAYVVVLREALQHLVTAVGCAQSLMPVLRPGVEGLLRVDLELEHARDVLRMDTGRQAQADLQNTADMNAEAQTVIEYVYPQLYGTPWAPRSGIPSEGDVREALGEIRRLIHESWALDALKTEGKSYEQDIS